jgi:signal peptidase I
MEKAWNITKNIILALVIVFSLLIILSSLNIGGFKMYVVKSGSMEPKIHTGSVVFDKGQKDYGVGDIITFKLANSKDTVTHRIFEVKPDAKNQIFYQVKGDANNSPDPELVAQNNVIGKTNFSIPLLGYLVGFVKSLPGLVILIIIPAVIIVYDEVTNIHTEIANIIRAKRKVVEEVEKVEEFVEEEEKKIARKLHKKSTKKEGAS